MKKRKIGVIHKFKLNTRSKVKSKIIEIKKKENDN